jgi:hypothetical protein
MNLIILIYMPLVILIPICIYALITEKKDKKAADSKAPANA